MGPEEAALGEGRGCQNVCPKLCVLCEVLPRGGLWTCLRLPCGKSRHQHCQYSIAESEHSLGIGIALSEGVGTSLPRVVPRGAQWDCEGGRSCRVVYESFKRAGEVWSLVFGVRHL